LSSNTTFSNSTAQSYALALYEISKENSELDLVLENMKNLKELLNNCKELQETILNPTISKEDKEKVFSIIANENKFPENLKKFLSYVAVKNRLFFLKKIIDNFLNLVSNIKGELKAKLISSKKLSQEEQKKIQNELSENFKSSLNISYKHDPELIAGLIIQVGSVMVDTSIKTKLKKLEESMIGV
jgi:F-type H+-transporting ATPase subunit delta